MRHFLCLIPVAALWVSPSFAADVSFKNEIAPILAARCAGCHGGAEAKAGYRVNSFTAMLSPGETESDPLTAGDPDASYLLELIESDDADARMPKEAEALPAEQRALIRRWIEEGAKFDGPDAKAALQSYLPQVTHAAPPEAYRFALPITAVAISPNGQEVAASGYHEITIWNAADGKLLRRIPNVAERTLGLAYSADGAMLAAAGGAPGVSGELRVYNPADGALVREVGRFADTAFAVTFNPDGTKLAVSGADRAIRVYQVADWSEATTIEDHADWVTAIAFSPDGARIASGSRDKTSKLFDVATGDALATYPNYGDAVYGVAFSADGAQVIAGGRAGRMDFWNAADGVRAAEVAVGGEIQRILAAGGQIFTVASDSHARQFKADDRAAVRTYAGHSDRLQSAAFDPAANRLVTGSINGEVRVWNTADGTQVTSFIAAPGFVTETAQVQAAAK
ncbi:MAG: c-type cytochrome domain-containing protein [Planctomycetia bacterium]|nr:c-type cytochrome domain-containing protein [Planctomycetia bacterium]